MQIPARKQTGREKDLLRYLLIFLSIVLVTIIIPKKGKFRYDFEVDKPWRHDNLVAPFPFAIEKTEAEITSEKKEIRDNFKPFYVRNDEIAERRIQAFNTKFKEEATNEGLEKTTTDFLLKQGNRILKEIYEKGIIKVDTAHQNKPATFIIQEVHNNIVEDQQALNYFTIKEAQQLIKDRTKADTNMNLASFIRPLLGSLDYNIIFDKDISDKKLSELLDNISLTRGMINEGDKIISKGNIVTPERYKVLSSLKKEYETKVSRGKSEWLLFTGYFILVVILFVMFGFNLELYHPEIIKQNRSVLSIMLNVLIFTFITSYFVKNEILHVYLIPYCAVPVLLLAFFGPRIALATHFLIILIAGLIVPNPYEFVLLQLLTGFVAVLSMMQIRYISQFFVASLLILMSYCLIYLGISFMQSSILQEVQWTIFLWFGANFILTLLAYPLIYANEKVFGFLSDISLLELSDINNKLLKELSVRAPGTFQHSLQVANLAEAVIDRIGGNALLTRVGALYHDIGKIYNPTYFIENQSFMTNPHTQLSEEESAEIIIQHVTKGVELAQEYNLPARIIDFIRSHHGTTRVEYFFQTYVKHHPQEEVDDTNFRYPGPKPSSKETAIVMIVDSVEAASRSLKDPDEKQIDMLVDKIIDHKLSDHQFDLATITIQELNTTRRLLKKLLKSIYHIRIIYPSETEEKKKI